MGGSTANLFFFVAKNLLSLDVVSRGRMQLKAFTFTQVAKAQHHWWKICRFSAQGRCSRNWQVAVFSSLQLKDCIGLQREDLWL